MTPTNEQGTHYPERSDPAEQHRAIILDQLAAKDAQKAELTRRVLGLPAIDGEDAQGARG